MLFHFLNFSQCVECMFGHKPIYKVTNLKVHSKGRYFVFKKIPFQELQWTTRLDYKVVFLYLWHHKFAYRNSNSWGGGLLVEHWTFQNQNPVLVFLYHCISDGNQLSSENFGCHFNFILNIMSDKAVFVCRALFCVQCYHGNLELSRSNSASRWQRINLHIYAATNNGINKFNCNTAYEHCAVCYPWIYAYEIICITDLPPY